MAQRRAQGWDVATYGLGGTVGPTIVAAVSAWASPTVAALLLAGATALAAVLVRMLPWAAPSGTPAEVPRPARTLLLMLSSGPLRRTLYMTVTVAFALAALPITAVAATTSLGVSAAAAGVLTAAYGLGNLAGSAAVMIRPLRGDADHLMTRLAVIVAVALAVAALAPGFALAAVAYFLTGFLNSHFFAATLAARSEYAPASARAQVFVWIGAVKITAGSAGTALAGTLIGFSLHLPLTLAVALVTLAAAVSVLERSAA